MLRILNNTKNNVFKLLLALTLFASVNGVIAEDINVVSNGDKSYFQDMNRRARIMGLEAIENKWRELNNMINTLDKESIKGEIKDIADSSIEPAYELKIFVSSSMSREMLKNYLETAAKYRASLVFNGLPGNSWQQLSNLVNEIADTENMGGIQIDNTAFEEYGVKMVPSIVLAQSKDFMEQFTQDENIVFDKIEGAISIKMALERFAQEGDMREAASELLGGVK